MLSVAGPAAADAAATVKFDLKPTAVQDNAIRLAAAADIADYIHPTGDDYVVGQADLNDDGRPDLIVRYDDIGFCGSSGCSGVIVMATAHGSASKTVRVHNFTTMEVLQNKHHGMHEPHFDDAAYIFKWNGTAYATPSNALSTRYRDWQRVVQ